MRTLKLFFLATTLFLNSSPARAGESIRVTVNGILRSGIMAIGGETTGTTVTAKGITWELAFGKNPAWHKAAGELDGKAVVVVGELERRKGVEIKERWIVKVNDFKGADDMQAASPISATSTRKGSEVEVLDDGGKPVVVVNSAKGIGSARVKREGERWPEGILVRLHLRGLESFKAAAGELAVEWSVSSTVGNPSRVALRRGRGEVAIGADSPYYSEARVVNGGKGKIPLQAGYFEVPLPAKLLEGNPEQITLNWIDFYRN